MSAGDAARGERGSGGGESPAAPAPHLLFRLGRRWFAMDVRAIEEVALKGPVTRVPTAPSHILGVTLLRGRLVTVISLEQMIGGAGMLSAENPVTLPRLVVVRHGAHALAVVAEEIGGMIEVPAPAGRGRSPDAPDFVRDEWSRQGSRVAVLDARLLLAATAWQAGIPSLFPDGGA
jgi:chemotaxis signal transduction protein